MDGARVEDGVELLGRRPRLGAGHLGGDGLLEKAGHFRLFLLYLVLECVGEEG